MFPATVKRDWFRIQFIVWKILSIGNNNFKTSYNDLLMLMRRA